MVASITASRLIAADQAIDHYVPLLNVASNAVNILLKIGICVNRALRSRDSFEQSRKNSPNGHYWEYLENKTFTSCVLGLIPGLAKVSTWFRTSLIASWDNLEFAKNLIRRDIDYIKQAPIAMLYNREFMVTALQQKNAQVVCQNAKYRSLPSEYRKSVEKEAGLGKQEMEQFGMLSNSSLLNKEQIEVLTAHSQASDSGY